MILLSAYRKRGAAALAALALLASGCGPGKIIHRDYETQNGVIFCVNSTVSNLDPVSNEINVTSVTLAQNVFNRLVRYDSAQNTFLPEIASSWTVSEDAMVYRFTLRDDVNFHSVPWFSPARSLTADDVVFSFERIMDYTAPDGDGSEAAAALTRSGYDILDFRHLLRVRQYVRSVTAVDRHTVEFQLVRPWSYFLELLANTNCIISSREFYDSIPDSPKKEDYFRNHPVGTGPFRLASMKFNDHIILERNPSYWLDPALPRLSKLVLDITPNRAERMNKMLTGECMVSNQPSKAVSATGGAAKNFSSLGSETYDATMIFFNTSRIPTNSPDVRRAVASAINREVYGSVLYPHSAMLPTSMLPFDVTFFATVAHQETAAAARLLAEKAPQILRRSGIVYVYIERSSSRMGYNISRLTQLLRSDLSALGLHPRVREVDARTLSRIAARNAYDIIVTRNIFPIKMPLYKLHAMFQCVDGRPAGGNYSAYCSTELQELLDRNKYLKLKDISLEDLQAINSRIERDLPMMTVSIASDYYIYHPALAGIRRSANHGLDFTEAHLLAP